MKKQDQLDCHDADCGICYSCVKDAMDAGEPLAKFDGPYGYHRLTMRNDNTDEKRELAQARVLALWALDDPRLDRLGHEFAAAMNRERVRFREGIPLLATLMIKALSGLPREEAALLSAPIITRLLELSAR